MMSGELNFMGLSGFIWWMGIVENRNDPLKLGRCQVRIFGWHSEEKTLIPTSDLPWAQPVIPLNDTSNVKAKEGDCVFGFFMDSNDAQFPVMLGIMPGIPDTRIDIKQGFSDPRTPDQLASAPRKPGQSSGVRYPTPLNEPTTSRLARNENIDNTIVGAKKTKTTKNIPVAGGSKFDEPATKYNSIYPYNRVMETESGHFIEIDDTPGAERIQIYHRSGTFDEIHPDGTKVTKVSGSDIEIVIGENKIYVNGDYSITSKNNINLKCGGNFNVEVGGSMNVDVINNVNFKVQNQTKIDSGTSILMQAARIDLNPDEAATFTSSSVSSEFPTPEASVFQNYPET